MGFLDHSSSNIIVDAVLTDLGRQFLARNDGSFSIVKFSLADDEVDYSIISKFGRVIGKEKIEKNTPIFEAQTSSNLALKYKMIGISNPYLAYLPVLEFDSANQIVSLVAGKTTTQTLTFKQVIPTADQNDYSDLNDSIFTIKIPYRFLSVQNSSPDFVDRDGIAYYSIPRDVNESNANQVKFTVALQNITDTQFSLYGSSNNQITVPISVSGLQSGAVVDVVIKISKS